MKLKSYALIGVSLLTSSLALADSRWRTEGRVIPDEPQRQRSPDMDRGHEDRGRGGDHATRGDDISRANEPPRDNGRPREMEPPRHDDSQRWSSDRRWTQQPERSHSDDREHGRRNDEHRDWRRDDRDGRHDEHRRGDWRGFNWLLGGNYWNYGDRDYRRDNYYYYSRPYYPSRDYRVPRGYYNSHRWRRGERLPEAYYDDRYWIHDYWSYNLHDPDYGCGWVRFERDAVLIELATGLVLDAVYDLYR